MTVDEIRRLIQTPVYNFLRNDPLLGNRIFLLTLGGSHAYGTNVASSDVDVRGGSMESSEQILSGHSFDQRIDNPTDTTIYSFPKLVHLLSMCNPNTIEILGCKPEHYLVLTDVGKELLDNVDMFLSKAAAFSFGGYANAQLQRLNNKALRTVDSEEARRHIIKTMNHAAETYTEHYGFTPRVYEHDEQICVGISGENVSLERLRAGLNNLAAIEKSFDTNSIRNRKAIEHGKLGKHMMHLVRLYLMAFDILEDGKVVTYREKEHDLLMDIRAGKYLTEDGMPNAEFIEMTDEFEVKLLSLKETSPLPAKPDYNRIQKFCTRVRRDIVLSEEG